MKFKEIDRDQGLAVLLMVGVLFGLLGLPILLQHLYGIDAITTAFAVIVLYALINWYMQKQNN